MTPSIPRPPRRPRRSQRIWPPNTGAAATVAFGFTGLLYVVEFLDVTLYAGRLDLYGIVPRSPHGLDGVLFAPLLHAGWDHLMANTVPVLVLGFLAMAGGGRQWFTVTATIWLVGGIGVWLTGAPGTITVGASGVIFGWLTFLLIRGWFNRSIMQILLGIALFVFWGGMLWGVLPGADGISWQGHLFGAIGGIVAAWMVGQASRPVGVPRRTAVP